MSNVDHPTIALVGFGQSPLSALADHLPAASIVVIEDPLVAEQRAIPGLAAHHRIVSRVVIEEYQAGGGDPDRLLAIAPELRGVTAVMPAVEYAVEPAARLAALLGLPGAGVRAAAVFRDKARQRQVASAAGLRNPRFAVIDSAAEAFAFVEAVGGRCVVKPTARQASVGVRFVHPEGGRHTVAEAVQQAASPGQRRGEPAHGLPSQVIVEEAIEGREYSVEMLVSAGRCCFANVTAKRLAGGDHPVELGHLAPGCPDKDLRSRLVADTVSLFTAAGFEHGVLHCEWIVSAAGLTLVECAARLPGDEITVLVTLAYDRPFIPAYLQVLGGNDPGYPAWASYGSAIRFLTAPPGRLIQVDGVLRATRAPGIRQATLTARLGDLLGPLTSSWDRAGYLIARADSAGEAMTLADEAASLIEFTVVPDLFAAPS